MRPSVAILEARLRERLASNVKRRREVLGLSLSDAAKLADMIAPEWQLIEHGELDVDMRTLARVAVALEIDARELLNAVPGMPQATAASLAGAERGRTGKEGA